ncbi:hypothetical protein BC936DRAFT_144605 [Jimgerdemannia flammicorona]|uniref:Uncharacterized protein n=1 Tax=Jimgerdemannia flammicorona TaxID=994334 RepID=A0A433DLZ4_9FUNG|nr:hypothetical protein BC936DRAFT_144605 [Jimgerdemannia flammicorona]
MGSTFALCRTTYASHIRETTTTGVPVSATGAINSEPTSTTAPTTAAGHCQHDFVQLGQPLPGPAVIREWATIAASSEASAASFTIASYNLLADHCMYENQRLYPHVPIGDISWDKRRESIWKEFKEKACDIFALQVHAQYHACMPTTPHIFTCSHPLDHLARRKLKKSITTKNLCPLSAPWATTDSIKGALHISKMVVPSLFTIEQSRLLEYKDKDSGYLSRGNVATIVILKVNNAQTDTPPYVCVGNTHLLFNPRRGIMKLGQLDLLFKAIDEELNGRDIPLIVCGDMNSTPDSLVTSFIESGLVDMSLIPEQLMSGQQRAQQAQQAQTRARPSKTAKITTPSPPMNMAAITTPTASPSDLVTIRRAMKNLEDIYLYRKQLPSEMRASVRTDVRSSLNQNAALDPMFDPILTHPFSLSSAYTYDGEGIFTSKHAGDMMVCDYLFYGGWKNPGAATTRAAAVASSLTASSTWNDVKVKEADADTSSVPMYQLRLLERLEIPVDVMRTVGYLPCLSRGLPSDHIMISAKFEFVRKRSENGGFI